MNILAMLEFQSPWFLLLALATALIVVSGYLVRRTGHPSQLWTTTVLRSLAFICLVLALAGPALVDTQRRTAVLFAVDRSASIANPRQVDTALSAMTAALGPKDMAGVLYFGADAQLAAEPTRAERLRVTDVNVDSGGTDVARALRTGALTLPTGYSGKVVLISDGNETVGDARLEARRLAAAGVVVDSVAVGGMSHGEASVRSVVAPDAVKAGEPFDVRVIIDSSAKQSGTVSVLRDGAPVAKREVDLKAGTNAFYVKQTLQADGPRRYEARLEASQDGMKGNNQAQAVVSVAGTPRLLVMGEAEAEATLLMGTLKKQGISTQFASPASAPRDLQSLNAYDGIVLNNLSALHFSDAYLALLRSYVEDLGGGLLALGGPNSFGLGGYRNTPLEAILPVSMDLRQKMKFPSMSMAIVLDRSGSMGGLGQGATKLDLAKEATMSVVDLLPDDSQLGVLTFDTEHEWSVPMSEVRDRDAIADRLARVQTGGGTQLYAPMVEAYKRLSGMPSVIRHVIVITDGQSEPGKFGEITQQMAKAGITVSTVAIGSDSDIPLLESIARLGNGRSYYTNDIFAIPRIFVTEAFMASRAIMVEEPFRPELRTTAPMLRGLAQGPIPMLLGRILAVAKPEATVQLESPQGDPVLASWRTGLGRSVAFLSDASGRWSKPWVGWSEAPKVWAGIARWVMRPSKDSPLQATARIESGRLVVGVDAIDDRGEYLDLLTLEARVSGAAGEPVSMALQQRGPGRYEAEAPISGPGSYLVVVRDTQGRLEPQTASLTLPYPEELRPKPIATGLLAEVAELAGGKLVTAESFVPGAGLTYVKTTRPVWPVLAIAGLILLLLDLLVRSLPEELWAGLTAPRAGRSVSTALRGAVARQAGAVQRYEDIVWKAKLGDQPKAAEKRYLDDVTPSRSAGLYIARLRRDKHQEEEAQNDASKGPGN